VKDKRKITMGVGAFVLSLGTMIMVGAPSAGATTPPVTCNTITGHIHFSPHLKNGGTAPETATIVLLIQGCVTGTPIPNHGNINSTTTTFGTGTNNCTGLAGGGAQALATNWHPLADGTSVTSYTGYNGVTNTASHVGLSFPSAGATAPTTGSYAQTSGSTMTIYSNRTATFVGTKCAGAAGLANLPITTGSTVQ
jgi:hypothetical protein